MAIWKNIHVNQYYKFSGLKVGMLQTALGGKIFLLKTTESSTFSDIDRFQIKNFHLVESLRNLISVPRIDKLITGSTPLISYQGVVTKLKNVERGIYELDSKLLLYLTFNIGCSILDAGSEIIISNAHLIKSDGDVPILVCCGSSCVKDSRHNGKSYSVPNDPHFDSFCIQYGLNIFDLLWFEKLLSSLRKKFVSLIAGGDVLFRQSSSFLKNTLEYFLCTENEVTIKKFSLIEEFLSNPHQCFPFLESRLPTGCCVARLSDILDGIIQNASWIEAGARWEFCVGSQDNSVIIGVLYISTNGNFYIADGTSKMPIILSEDCDGCCHDQDIVEEFKNSNSASVVAIQEYDIIVENIFCTNGIRRSIQYIRTTFCRLCLLFSLCKSTTNDFFTPRDFSRESQKDAGISDFLGNSEETNCRFLVLSKIWTLQNKVPCYSHVLVLFLSEDSQNNDENESISETTFNFGDDTEFANLVSELNLLHIEDKQVKLGYLCFGTATQDNVVFPGHIYTISSKESSKTLTSERMFTWTVTPDMKVVHDPMCRGGYDFEDYEDAEYHGIKEILLKRHLNRNWIVTGILRDKLYEDEGKLSEKSNATLCMIVKDVKSEESSIKIYVPHFAGSLCGLLPGTLLQLYGFLCFCSRNGSLYLKASPMFGILIKQTLSGKYRSENSGLPKDSDFPLQTICFVMKITSAEIFLVCSKCGINFLERCLCHCQKKIKVKLNALIDDGNRVLLAHCDDGTAKKILNIDSGEWQSLVSYVEVSRQFLKFSNRVPKNKADLLPLMNQVFNIYCSSKATSRKLMFEYFNVPKSYSNPSSVWCKSVDDVDCQKHFQKLYLKLMNN